jgi:hypothetical protein
MGIDKYEYHTAKGKMTPAICNAKYRAKKKGIFKPTHWMLQPKPPEDKA